jgi:hypothetical protein
MTILGVEKYNDSSLADRSALTGNVTLTLAPTKGGGLGLLTGVF